LFVHDIDPVILRAGSIYLWYYGAAYSLGFLALLYWVKTQSCAYQADEREHYSLAILLALGVLIGGRAVEVALYEWDLYGSRLSLIPAYWLGGMATHGILFGGLFALLIYCLIYKRSFLEVADHLAVPAALIMGLGRLGNFIDGQIVGAHSDAWWAVTFPDVEGPRHPVVLYDGLKNLLLIPLLLLIRRRNPPPGTLFAHFILWYGLLRFLLDYFREYRVDLFGLGPGQYMNLGMAAAGLLLLVWLKFRGQSVEQMPPLPAVAGKPPGVARRVIFALLLIFPLVIPSDWTQDAPLRYAERHPGMERTIFYPPLPERAP
jgi:phosphatidylglycerol:prolipoprotein diacylglycerol transferase